MAKFKKGESGNLAGRPPGAHNKETQDTRERIRKVLDELFTPDAIITDLEGLEARDRINILIKLLEYSTPKLSHVEYQSDIDRLNDQQVEMIFERLQNMVLMGKN